LYYDDYENQEPEVPMDATVLVGGIKRKKKARHASNANKQVKMTPMHRFCEQVRAAAATDPCFNGT
jgi:hypothetical protein